MDFAGTFALGLVLATGGCVGDDCDVDADCLSNSCTWGTCDSAVVNAAFRDDEPAPAVRPDKQPRCEPKTNCEWLLVDACRAESSCRVEKQCTGYVECSLDQFINGCPVPCELRSDDECTGACSLTFYACEQQRSCDGLLGEACTKTPGCELR